MSLTFPKEDEKAIYYRTGVKGTSMAIAKSAMQKAIRRNHVDVSQYWAAVLLASHKIANLMHRLVTIAFEDVGPADLGAVTYAVRCFVKYTELRKKANDEKTEQWRYLRNSGEIRALVHNLVQRLCVARKSRIVDDAFIAFGAPTFDSVHKCLIGKEKHLTDLGNAVSTFDVQAAVYNMAALCKCEGTDILLYYLRQLLPNEPAVRAAELMRKDQGKKARPPFMPITYALLLACGTKAQEPTREIVEVEPCFVSADELEAINKLYGELTDATVPRREHPDYALDMHVAGIKKGSVRAFVEMESDALSPKSDLPNPYHEKALTTGAEAREENALAKRRLQSEKRTSKKRKASPVSSSSTSSSDAEEITSVAKARRKTEKSKKKTSTSKKRKASPVSSSSPSSSSSDVEEITSVAKTRRKTGKSKKKTSGQGM